MFRAPMHPPFVRALCVAFALAVPISASAADDSVARAKEAYDRGVRAHAAGDHRSAARAFAEADALAPSTASIEAALESAMKADDVVLGAELVERTSQRSVDAAAAKVVDAAKKQFAGRTGKIRVECNFATRCLASVDGAASDAWHAIVVPIGAHSVVVQRDDERFDQLVDVGAESVVVVRGPVPFRREASPPQRDTSSAGLSPVWFFVGVGVTAALGGMTVLSGLDTVHQHDRFASDGCSLGSTGPRPADCDSRATDGQSAKTRTNVLLAVTGVAAIATAITGAFFVRWSARNDGGTAEVAMRWP